MLLGAVYNILLYCIVAAVCSPGENILDFKTLVVLDRSSGGRRQDPYTLLLNHPQILEAFDSVLYTSHLARALESIRGRKIPPVVVIGPGFLATYSAGQKALGGLFAKVGVSDDKLVTIHEEPYGQPLVCEYQGKLLHETIPNVVFRASGYQPV